MILTAVAVPSPDGIQPPYVRLTADAGEGLEFDTLVISRNGQPLRMQPPVGGVRETYVDDYEAPFGVPVTYTAQATVSSAGWLPAYTETWDTLDAWVLEEGAPYIASGGCISGGPGTMHRPGGLSGYLWRVTFEPGYFISAQMFTGSRRWAAFWDEFLNGVAVWTYDGFAIIPSHQYDNDLPVQVYGDNAGTYINVAHNGFTYAVSDPGGDNVWGTAEPGNTDMVFLLNGGASQCLGFSVESAPAPITPVQVADSVVVTLDEQYPWLIHPANPTLSVRFDEPCTGAYCNSVQHLHLDPTTATETDYESRQSVFETNGRRESVMFPLGQLSFGQFELVINATGLQARNRLMAPLIDQAPVLLRMPPSYAVYDVPDGWYAVTGPKVRRATDQDLRSPYRIATLPLMRVAIPPVPVAPRFTWGTVRTRGLTWGDLASHTWFDVLQGDL